jgi:hypothetical protein
MVRMASVFIDAHLWPLIGDNTSCKVNSMLKQARACSRLQSTRLLLEIGVAVLGSKLLIDVQCWRASKQDPTFLRSRCTTGGACKRPLGLAEWR